MERINKFLKCINNRGVKILLLTNIVTLLILLWLLKTGGYIHKLKVEIGLIDAPFAPDYWAVKGWENTIKQLNIQHDIAFFGNSITYYGNFQAAYPDKKVINLGYPGDNLDGMLKRVETLKAVSPDKIFLMGGINGLKNTDFQTFKQKYGILVDSVQTELPHSQIYLQSILPISKMKEKDYGSNVKIVECNKIIQKIAKEKRCVYVDLYSLYVKDGEMPESLTEDGIHLRTEAYDRWYNSERQIVEK